MKSLRQLRLEAAGCRNCELWQRGTQTVFGEGPRTARVMLVGEQPGDQEDLTGRPFVGPAGRLLDEALEAAGIARELVYVTNAVKHFNWEGRGKRRIHKKPRAPHIRACRIWLDAEIDTLAPRVIVALGAVAAQALLGPSVRVTRDHGRAITSGDRTVVVTTHPSAILRAPDAAAREAGRQQLVDDLKAVRMLLRR